MSRSIIEGLKFDIRRPKDFTPAQRLDVQAFRMRHYQAALSESLPDMDVAAFVLATSRKSWDNPNKSPDRTSRRANPRVVTASDPSNDRLVGMVYVAEDASSSRLGIIEKMAKLKADTLAKYQLLPPNLAEYLANHCFLWVREAIADQNRPLVLETLGALATHPEFNDQLDHPVSCFPWDGEGVLKANLEEVGFTEIGEPKTVQPIPGSELEVIQHTFIHDSRIALHGTIMELTGVEAAIAVALPQVA
jgi:hypothetical protein